jgi:hypothetical protein
MLGALVSSHPTPSFPLRPSQTPFEKYSACEPAAA